MPEHIRLVHLDEDQYQLGKNYPLAAALWGSTKGGLTVLDAELSRRMTAEQTAAARRRAERARRARIGRRASRCAAKPRRSGICGR